jgi:hypothetical protein
MVQTFKEFKPRSNAVISYGRMNPGPTIGHEKLINTVKELADKNKAHHEVILSHVHSDKNNHNPLTPDQKLDFSKRFFPDVNFVASTKETPNILYHLARLHKDGHTHVTVVAGGDRIKDFARFVANTNGQEGKHGYFNFQKIDFKTSGDRDPDSDGPEGASATKLRKAAKSDDFTTFRSLLPKHVSAHDARALYDATRTGLRCINSKNNAED